MTDKNKDTSDIKVGVDAGVEESDRRFRRYHRARARQAKARRDDANFLAAVYSLAGVGAALAIGLAVFGMTGGGRIAGLEGLAAPWIGPVTKLEAFGVGFIALLAGLYFWRVRKRK